MFGPANMRCLTKAEQDEWVSEHGFVRYPYGSDQTIAPKKYVQFRAPQTLPAIEALIHAFYDLFAGDEETLLAIDDWPLYETYEMRLVDHVRSAHDEKRNLIEASGHLFLNNESDDLIGLTSLTVGFRWTSYLYFFSSKVTILNWEGELLDFWAETTDNLESVTSLIDRFQLGKS